MRRVCLVVLAAACVAACSAGAAGASGGGPYAYGVGGGWMGFAPGEHVAHFAFSAHEGPNGDFGQVHWNLEDPQLPLDVTISVDCVNVFPSLVGGTAWMDGPVTKVSPQPNAYTITVGTRLAFEAVDSGLPSATTMVDEFDAFYETTPCKLQPPMYLGPDVTQGNIVVSTG